MSLTGKIAIVTGGSRGIGRGIALQLGEAGATVYVTGRKPSDSDAAKMTSLPQLEQTAKDICTRGGRGIASFVDHSNMTEVKEFFKKFSEENNGQLDILVNNAYSAVHTIFTNRPFYECPPEMWDEVNNVGLRNHYYCSVYAARLMQKNQNGLIVNVTSAGGLRYLFNVPYGVGKHALDRLSADMAIELKSSNVCVFSLLPGAVRTEIITQHYGEGEGKLDTGEVAEMFRNGESVEYPGKGVVALAKDTNRLNKTGRILPTADLGAEYGFIDIDGRTPPNMRSLSSLLSLAGYKRAAGWIPQFVKLPGWLIWSATNRL